ncbi:hypothetical protein [Streptomyces sp. 7N604]|uniref:hypothetical protein n=1 Tax=Streptomyces sp. 7N604 TaxID=3457415 RepID=UPI003FCEFF7B
MEGGGQVGVAPLLVGGSQGPYEAACVADGCRWSLGGDEEVEESVALDGAACEGQAQCGFEEQAGGFGFEGCGVVLGSLEGDAIEGFGVLLEVFGVAAEAVEDVTGGAWSRFGSEGFDDERGGAVGGCELVPGGQEDFGSAEPQP